MKRVALGLVALVLAGCSAWHGAAVPEPAPPSAAARHGGSVRVRLADGRTFHLSHAYVDGDSLRGDVTFDERTAAGGRRAAFALRDVRTLDDRRFDAGSTMALFLGLVLVTGWALRGLVGAIVEGSD